MYFWPFFLFTPDEFFLHVISPFLVRVKTRVKEIGKENQFEDKKQDKQFNENDDPKLSANGHVAKPLIIEQSDATKQFQQPLFLIRSLSPASSCTAAAEASSAETAEAASASAAKTASSATASAEIIPGTAVAAPH